LLYLNVLMPNTLYLPGFSHRLYGSRPRKAGKALAGAADDLSGLGEVCGRFFPAKLLVTAKGGRDRMFPVLVTFWAFLSQVLTRNGSCRDAVRRVQALRAKAGKELPSDDTSAYCQARANLPLELLRRVFEAIGQWMEQRHQVSYLWAGHNVKVIDGTGMSMPDTKLNREKWPYAGGQKPGCGFPVAQMVGLFCLSTGRLVRFVTSSWKCHEIPQARQLLKWINPSEILLADRGFCGWVLIALFLRKQVHVVLRLHQARKDTSGLCVWKKPQWRRNWERSLWKELPLTLTMRIVHFRVVVPGFRTEQITLVTSLLDTALYPDKALAELYLRRWRVELYYRDIKCSLGLDVLRCNTPDMVEKEIWMQAIAYNMVRAIMLEASITHSIDLERLSFKGTVDTLLSWTPLLPTGKPRKTKQFIDEMLLVIASDTVPLRPKRSEPRVKKRRPKNYQLLTKPRHRMAVSASRNKK